MSLAYFAIGFAVGTIVGCWQALWHTFGDWWHCRHDMALWRKYDAGVTEGYRRSAEICVEGKSGFYPHDFVLDRAAHKILERIGE